jgi:site-specific DNA recombinase
VQYVSENNHPAIISKETFKAVSIEKVRGCNVTKIENENQRKGKKYNSKK